MFKSQAIVLSVFAIFVFTTAHAAKLPPLDELTTTQGIKEYYDLSKIVAIYRAPTIVPGIQPGVANIQKGHPATFIVGITPFPIPISDDPKTFLNDKKLTLKFAVLHDLTGELYLKANSVVSLDAPNIPLVDKRIKTFISPGPPSSGTVKVWEVFETPEQVRDIINAVRQQQDAGDM